MDQIIIDGKVYKELKIKNLIIGNTVTEGFVISSDKLNGESNLNIDIQAENASTNQATTDSIESPTEASSEETSKPSSN